MVALIERKISFAIFEEIDALLAVGETAFSNTR